MAAKWTEVPVGEHHVLVMWIEPNSRGGAGKPKLRWGVYETGNRENPIMLNDAVDHRTITNLIDMAKVHAMSK